MASSQVPPSSGGAATDVVPLGSSSAGGGGGARSSSMSRAAHMRTSPRSSGRQKGSQSQERQQQQQQQFGAAYFQQPPLPAPSAGGGASIPIVLSFPQIKNCVPYKLSYCGSPGNLSLAVVKGLSPKKGNFRLEKTISVFAGLYNLISPLHSQLQVLFPQAGGRHRDHAGGDSRRRDRPHPQREGHSGVHGPGGLRGPLTLLLSPYQTQDLVQKARRNLR